jgi:hypothetical protein
VIHFVRGAVLCVCLLGALILKISGNPVASPAPQETAAHKPVAPTVVPDIPRPAQADHRDSPLSIVDPAADVNDVYAFVNQNNGNVVLAMTVNPFQAPGNVQYFSPEVLYQIKIDNTGDYKEDLVFQITFDKATPDQKFQIVGPVKPKKVGATTELIKVKAGDTPVVTGPANATVVTGSTLKAYCGLSDDPFFFDFDYVERLLGIIAGGPLTRAPGIDFFAGFNVSIIAIEIPAAQLKGSAGNTIHVWATTSRSSSTRRSEKTGDKDTNSYVQIDRMGLPAVNTVLIRTGATATEKGTLKDKFNLGVPSTDVEQFSAEVNKQLLLLNNDQTTSDALTKAVLPDVLTLDVTSTKGFLNGRRPEDVVIDAELSLFTKGGVPGDGVNANDVPFLTDFPFFAPAHTAATAIAPRD